jgi:LuxR family transcriptional regulator of csgAB operon
LIVDEVAMENASHQKSVLFAVASRGFVIVGQSSMQNTLLANMLERHLGGRCEVISVEATRAGKFGNGTITLVDSAAIPPAGMEAVLGMLSGVAATHSIAVFNADEGVPADQLLHWPKLKGFFPRSTSEDQLIKGLKAILNGENWLPRKMLANYLELSRRTGQVRLGESVELTRMEKETLQVMVGGASNVDIATALNLSPHTVKTHLYNLFRKIRVRNRVQAVSWALTNLVPAERGEK